MNKLYYSIGFHCENIILQKSIRYKYFRTNNESQRGGLVNGTNTYNETPVEPILYFIKTCLTFLVPIKRDHNKMSKIKTLFVQFIFEVSIIL